MTLSPCCTLQNVLVTQSASLWFCCCCWLLHPYTDSMPSPFFIINFVIFIFSYFAFFFYFMFFYLFHIFSSFLLFLWLHPKFPDSPWLSRLVGALIMPWTITDEFNVIPKTKQKLEKTKGVRMIPLVFPGITIFAIMFPISNSHQNQCSAPSYAFNLE